MEEHISMLSFNRYGPRAARQCSRSPLAVTVRRWSTSNTVNPTATLISQVVVVAAAHLVHRRRRDHVATGDQSESPDLTLPMSNPSPSTPSLHAT
ncbi:unnamed protein product [Linum trigynum]|uniref:Uncharacterized protein n=1 Tax=Linum trigynum TaxID=586398 RepID=A0AAV2GC44_9ROSI